MSSGGMEVKTFRMLRHLPDCPGQVKVRLGKHFERPRHITVVRIEQAKSVLWTCNFPQQKKTFSFLLGASKNVIWKCVSLNLYFTCPNGQVVIKPYAAPCLYLHTCIFASK